MCGKERKRDKSLSRSALSWLTVSVYAALLFMTAVTVARAEETDNSELFYRYLQQAAGREVRLRSAPVRLEGLPRVLYDAYLPFIQKVAAGEEPDAVHHLTFETGNELRISLTELGLDETAGTSAIHEAVYQYIQNAQLPAIRMLMTNYPYELYWYDKTAWDWFDFDLQRENDEICLNGLDTYFRVAVDYQGMTSSYNIDTEKVRKAIAAAQNARAIKDRYTALGDYDKLDAYRQEICELTAYNDDAWHDGHQAMPYGDPWQLVWVFDGDPATNVVCEGYAKAFQFLCDLSTFQGDVQCYTVRGTMGWQSGEEYDTEAHMWNVVRKDEVNYLVDVTNCDDESGYPDRLFMTGATGGIIWNPAEGIRYTDCYQIDFAWGEMYYTNDEVTTSVIHDEDLQLTTEMTEGNSNCIWDNHWGWRITPTGTLLLDDLSQFYEEPGSQPPSAAPWTTERNRITRVVLSSRTQEIPDGLTERLDKVISIEVTGQHPVYETRNGILYAKGSDRPALFPMGRAQRLPADLKTIEANAFEGIDAEAIIVPAGCEYIGDRAFANCPNLVYVSYPESTTLAGDPFAGSSVKTCNVYGVQQD